MKICKELLIFLETQIFYDLSASFVFELEKQVLNELEALSDELEIETIDNVRIHAHEKHFGFFWLDKIGIIRCLLHNGKKDIPIGIQWATNPFELGSQVYTDIFTADNIKFAIEKDL